jgi:hypothetical protein
MHPRQTSVNGNEGVYVRMKLLQRLCDECAVGVGAGPLRRENAADAEVCELSNPDDFVKRKAERGGWNGESGEW